MIHRKPRQPKKQEPLSVRIATHCDCPLCGGTRLIRAVEAGKVVQTACQFWGQGGRKHDDTRLVYPGESLAARMVGQGVGQ